MDIRIINTKNRIQKGLIAAMKEEPLYQVKDKEVISKAEISSASYYKYYADKSEVLKDLEKELFDEFYEALSHDAQNWRTTNHSPSKKDIERLINRNIDQITEFFNKHVEYISVLISDNGDPHFAHQLLNATSKMVTKMIIYYFHIYNQEHILKKDYFKLQFTSQRYAQAFLDPLFIWSRHPAELSLSDAKKLMKEMVLRSPYETSTHGF